MEGGEKRESKVKLNESSRSFLDTLLEEISTLDNNWISSRGKGEGVVVYTLGSGASNVETAAITFLFPQSSRVAVDIDNIGRLMAEHYGFYFLRRSAREPTIYDHERGGQPDLVIIRNPSPRDREMWKEAIRLAWDKMKEGGILYMTASLISDRDIFSEVLKESLNLSDEEVLWKINSRPLGTDSFPDSFVIALIKKSKGTQPQPT